LKIILHREIEGQIKTKTGIDVGLTSLITFSNGEQIKPPKYLRASEKRLAREQIHLSKKKLRSKNRNNQRIIVAKIHRKIRNQRKDFNHKTSRNLVNTYDHIVFEDLQIRNMMHNHHLAKSISDASWSQLINLTKSKAEYAGKVVELVNAKGTSQTCICGHPVLKDLSVRIHNCPKCGLMLSRDHVSAMLIENRSISTVGTTGLQAQLRNLNREPMKWEAPGF